MLASRRQLVMNSPGRSVSYESDNEMRTISSGVHEKIKDNGDKSGHADYSDEEDERLDIDDESHGGGNLTRKLATTGASVEKLEGNLTHQFDHFLSYLWRKQSRV